MKPKTEALLTELIGVLLQAGMRREAEDITRYKKELESSSPNHRAAAAEAITTCCHVKWLGDAELPVKREEPYATLKFLGEVKAAIKAELREQP